jgi:hypothetical protein
MEDRIPEVPFYRASTVPRVFEVVSRLRPIRMHWDQTANRARVCGRHVCALCRDGMKSEIRWLLRLQETPDSHYLLELRERHRSFCEEVSAVQDRNLSAVVSVFRDGTLRNSPVECQLLREGVATALFDLRRLVDACYLPPITLREGIRVEPDDPLPALGQVQDTRILDQISARCPDRAARVAARMTNWPRRK